MEKEKDLKQLAKVEKTIEQTAESQEMEDDSYLVRFKKPFVFEGGKS